MQGGNKRGKVNMLSFLARESLIRDICSYSQYFEF